MTRKLLFSFFLSLVGLLLTSCVNLPDPESAQEFNKDQVAAITQNHTVGQTFFARRGHLSGIVLWLQTDHPGVPITVELFHNIGDSSPVFSGNISAQDGKTQIAIPPLSDPSNQSYYLRLSSSTSGDVHLLGRNEDNYVSGMATIDDQTIDADLAFRTTYKYYLASALEDLWGLLDNWFLILPLWIVLILPGWLFLDFSHLKEQFDWGERVAISLGLSLTIIPMLMLWTSLVGLRWGSISIWFGAGLLIALSIWKVFKKTEYQPLTVKLRNPVSLILAAIFALTLFTRFAMVRDLAAPPWVDSIHHGLITRLMLESGGLPETYVPYLPPETDYYHFGFHSALAAFTWLTDLEIHESMLIFGQVLNALIIFPIYLLAKTLTKNRAAALSAALISGLFTLMPAYYVSWGRYTQLAGLLILPAAFTFFVQISNTKNFSFRQHRSLWALGTILVAGLFLVHYRVTAFLGALIFAYLLAQMNPREWFKFVGKLILLAAVSSMLLLPWLPGAIENLLLPKGIAWTGGKVNFSPIPWNFLTPALGETALILAGIGLLLGFILRKRFTLTILMWAGIIYLLANMGIFRLPGSGFVNPVSVDITLFMPIAVLGGFAVGAILDLLNKIIPVRWQVIPKTGFVALGFAAAIFGAQRLLPTLNPITFLAREADFPAIDWIEENIPTGDTILINPTVWGYGLYMGNDGGYWISPLSEHLTMPPPVLYGLGTAPEITRINQIIEQVIANGNDAEALWEILQEQNINYVFNGVQGGEISPMALSDSRLFEVRYQANGTWLFEVMKKPP